MDAREIVARMRAMENAENIAGMARFGITGRGILGISVAGIHVIRREVLKEFRRDPDARHALAAELWASELHEVRILAALVDVPALVARPQMDAWAADFDSWDLVDQVCCNLFDRTDLGWQAVYDWAARDQEFVKRAGYVTLAGLAWHRREVPDERYLPYLAFIEATADDPRNFVWKAQNWALRQIGKRSVALNVEAVAVAERMRHSESRAARRVGADAYRELTGEAVRAKLGLPPLP